MKNILEVKNLSVEFGGGESSARAVRGISFEIEEGQTLGLVGESGCGKSVSSLALMGLVSDPGRVEAQSINFDEQQLDKFSNRQMRNIRGRDIAMIFQEPMTSLNPVFTIGQQITEAVFAHEKVSASVARQRAVQSLDEVGIPAPEECLSRYPHELSGGMKQRVMIAMGLICRPKLIIADEPTTALDVTVQAQILELLQKLQRDHGMSMLFITHDLGVVAEIATRVCVMYAGAIVEKSKTEEIFADPLHPYTKGLLKSVPRLTGERKKLYTISGSVPDPRKLPEGCKFSPRCPFKTEICESVEPQLEEKIPGRLCACHNVKGGM